MSARASRRAFAFGSLAKNGLIGVRTGVGRPAPPAAAGTGAGGCGRATGGGVMGRETGGAIGGVIGLGAGGDRAGFTGRATGGAPVTEGRGAAGVGGGADR